MNYTLHALCFLANNQTPVRILELKTGKYRFGKDVYSIDNSYLRYKLEIRLQGNRLLKHYCILIGGYLERVNIQNPLTLLKQYICNESSALFFQYTCIVNTYCLNFAVSLIMWYLSWFYMIFSADYEKIPMYGDIKLDFSNSAHCSYHLLYILGLTIALAFGVQPRHVLERRWVCTAYSNDIALCKVIQHQTSTLVGSKREEAHSHLDCFPILMWVKGLLFSKCT